MQPTLATHDADLIIIGLSARIDPSLAASQIPALWQRFATTFSAGQRPIYAVYCDYEADGARPYTMVLGVEATRTAEVAPGLRRVTVPRGAYASFEASGDPRQVIWQRWSFINTAWVDRPRRRFIADYERYAGPPATDGSIVAEICVGLS